MEDGGVGGGQPARQVRRADRVGDDLAGRHVARLGGRVAAAGVLVPLGVAVVMLEQLTAKVRRR